MLYVLLDDCSRRHPFVGVFTTYAKVESVHQKLVNSSGGCYTILPVALDEYRVNNVTHIALEKAQGGE